MVQADSFTAYATCFLTLEIMVGIFSFSNQIYLIKYKSVIDNKIKIPNKL